MCLQKICYAIDGPIKIWSMVFAELEGWYFVPARSAYMFVQINELCSGVYVFVYVTCKRFHKNSL